MRHFFPKNTVEATIWCTKCAKETPHRIYGGRPMCCLVCLHKLDEMAAAPKAAPATVQERLF